MLTKRTNTMPETTRVANRIGQVYLNSSPELQKAFCSCLNAYGKKYGIETNLSKQFRQTEMYQPLHNVRLAVAIVAYELFELPIIKNKMTSVVSSTENLPLKPQEV